MVEQLSLVASVLALLLAVSLMIPTRKRVASKLESSQASSNNNTTWIELAYDLAIRHWTSRNTLQRQLSEPVFATSTSAELDLFGKLASNSPSNWLEVKSKQLNEQQALGICQRSSSGTKWCLYAFDCTLGATDGDTPAMQAELGYREVVQVWKQELSQFGLLMGLPNSRLVLAVPYSTTSDSSFDSNSNLAKQLYAKLGAGQVSVGDSPMNYGCRVRFTEAIDSDHISEAMQRLLQDEDKEHSIRGYEAGDWHNIDASNVHAENRVNAAHALRDEDADTAIVSPDEAAKLVASSKKTPAAVCIKDDEDAQEPVVAPAAETKPAPEGKSDKPSEPVTKPIVAESPKPSVETPVEQTRQANPPAPAVADDSVVESKSDKETPPENAVNSNEIDELFAIARKRKEKADQAASKETKPTAPSISESVENTALEDIKEIQDTVNSARAEAVTTDVAAIDAKEAVTADDIAKLFAAARSKS